ncbi:InlB B-repeat-containing protein [Bifidobacterium asteroides]|uniref:RCC1 domain-containing protein n=1 Tax=Bifidobacterium asteroides TaxID=1684 RepID=UPI000C085FE9|nr:InlB B-repeat-containing protein [Bifidobacterium asteroides]
MHQGTRLRRASATTILLLGLLAGLGAATADADAPPSIKGGRQTPHTAGQTPGIPTGSTANTPLPSPSPIQTTTPLGSATPSPSTPSSTTINKDGTDLAPVKSAEKTDTQTSHTVRFDPDDGGTPTRASVEAGTLASPPQHNPVRGGFRFDGWTLDSQPYDFRTPVLQDTTLKAQWSKTTDWTLSPDHGPATGTRLTISPPDRQEPCYTSIQAAGSQILGLTGDGLIHTWTQDSIPEQVLSPTQAPEGFRYLQAAAGSRRQAALGSDQRIYTWTSQQPAPTLLDTGPDTRFTSISMNDNRLLAVDRQGQVHAYQASDADSRNPNPKFTQQATTGLPEPAQAVTAAASDSRILIVDSDGQAWTRNTNNTVKAKPEPIRQEPGTRIIQAQALNQGFLLLDTDGQAYFLADSTTSTTVLSLPGQLKASKITGNDSQAIITDKNGKVWAWKPGQTPMRADNGNQPYTQAAATGGRITAISRQGGMFTWGLDGQGRPGQPARLSTTTTPILETASMDGQPLTPDKTGDAWQTEVPARQPGQATIVITGKQDGQLFTRSLTYTVDQPLLRDTRPASTHTVTFDTAGGSPTPGPQQVAYPYGRVRRPTPDPVREGHQFDGWFIGNIAYDFGKPVTENLTLTAKWTSKTPNTSWRINPDQGSQLGHETTTITPPDSTSGIRFNQISAGGYVMNDLMGFSLAVGSDGNAYAWGYNGFGQIGDGTTANRTMPVMVKKPAGVPTDFTYVQVAAGGYHSLAIGSDGYTYAWGNNDFGQLGNNTTANSSVPVRVHSPNGSGTGLKAIQVSTGMRSSMALGADGTVYTWGSLSAGNGQYTSQQTVPAAVMDPADASGVFHALQIGTQWSFNLAIGQDHYVYAWGYNNYGQLGNNTSDGLNTNTAHPTPKRVFSSSQSTAAAGPWLKATKVSAGGWHALAIDEDGNTWAWGRNIAGQLGNGSNSGDDPNPIPQKVRYPTDAGTVTAIQISGGDSHTLAIDTNGNAWAWGISNYNQIGDNAGYNRYSPVRVFASAQSTSSAGPWLKVAQVSAGYFHSSAIDTDGYARAWGDNRYGAIGNPDAGSPSPAPMPVVFNLSPVINGVTFDTSPATNLSHISNNSVTVLTPEHLPGPVTVSVAYTMGGAGRTLTDTSLTYTYLPAGVLPRAGGEGILLALATGMTGMGGVLASRRHRREQHKLSNISHE